MTNTVVNGVGVNWLPGGEKKDAGYGGQKGVSRIDRKNWRARKVQGMEGGGIGEKGEE